MTTTDNTSKSFGNNLLAILMIGMLVHFLTQSCQERKGLGIKYPSEIYKEKADSARADSILKSAADSVAMAASDTIQTNKLKPETQK